MVVFFHGVAIGLNGVMWLGDGGSQCLIFGERIFLPVVGVSAWRLWCHFGRRFIGLKGTSRWVQYCVLGEGMAQLCDFFLSFFKFKPSSWRGFRSRGHGHTG
jgi:hypothetical protein